MPIGFIGLGTMGPHMAGHLQKAGYQLVVNDLRKDAAAAASRGRRDLGRHAARGRRAMRRDLHLAAGAAGCREGRARRRTDCSPASSTARPGSTSPPTRRAW